MQGCSIHFSMLCKYVLKLDELFYLKSAGSKFLIQIGRKLISNVYWKNVK